MEGSPYLLLQSRDPGDPMREHEVLCFASSLGVRATVEELPLEGANDALRALRSGGARGARVLRVRS